MDDVRHETIDASGSQTDAVPTGPLLGVSPGGWDQPSPAVPDRAALDAETHRLLDFAAGARSSDGGFANLDSDGHIVGDGLVETWVSTRMTYCFVLGLLIGRPADADLVDHGVRALAPGGLLHDDENGGWFASTDDDTKAAYAHAFVVLAAASAVVAGRVGSEPLLHSALAIIGDRFWDEDAGMMRESFSADWAHEEPYRGANANMHSVEAFLAAADALGPDGDVWRERAGRIVERVVHDIARNADWRLPEHFTPDYQVVRDYNTGDRAHKFRPYGVTPGHLFEWARLCLHLRAADAAAGAPARDWLVADSQGLYRTAVEIGWASDGQDGFVYTTDFDGTPITRARMHWVVTEALGAAAALHQVTGEESYAHDHARWWAFAEAHLIDRVRGSWFAELDGQLQPASGTWSGKPDVYHALQATLLPRLPLSPMFAAALRSLRER